MHDPSPRPRSPATTARTAPSAKRTAYLLAIPALAALAVYAPSIGNGFAYDDVTAIVRNPLLHGLRTLPSALSQAYWLSQGNLYRPLTLLSWGLEWQASGGQPWLFHLLNVLWHAAATLLVTRLALRWLPAAGALCAGLAFALHPVHAEAVANAVGRSEIVAAAMLAALGLAVTAPHAEPTRMRAVAVALLAAGALASKEVGVVAPAVAFGLAWARPGTPRRLEPALGYALAALAGVLPLLLARWLVLGTLAGDRPHHAFTAAPPVQEALLVLGALPRAALLLVAPLRPRLDWAPTMAAVLAPSVAMAVLGAMVVLGVAAMLVRHLRAPSVPGVAIWFAAAAIAPTSNLLFRSGVVLAERTLYTPSIGACLLLGAAAHAACARGGWLRRTALVAGAAWIVAALAITPRENAVWRDNERLGAAMLERAPDSYRAHLFAGSLRRGTGDLADARAHYRQGIALFADDAGMLFDAATVEARLGERPQAIRYLSRAVTLEPERRGARTLLARYLIAEGRGGEALRVLEEGIRREPDLWLWGKWADSLRSGGRRRRHEAGSGTSGQ